jgi:hypothetical protein
MQMGNASRFAVSLMADVVVAAIAIGAQGPADPFLAGFQNPPAAGSAGTG